MSLAKNIFRGVVWNHAGRIIEYGLVYLLSVLIARILGPEMNGIYALALGVVYILLVLASFGLETSVNSFFPRLIREAPHETAVGAFRGALMVRLIAVCVVGVVFLLSRDVITRLLNAQHLFVDLLIVIVLYFALRSLVSLFVSVLTAKLETRTVTSIGVVVRLFELTGAAILLIKGYGLKEVFLLITTTAFLQACVLAFVLKDFFIGPSSKQARSPMIRLGGKFWVNGLLEFILGKQADILLLSYFMIGARGIGQYDVAMNFAQLINFGLTTGLYGVSIAAFSSVAALNVALVPKYWESLSRFVIIAVAPALVFAASFARVLLPWVYSSEYQQSVVLFQIYAVFLLITRLFGGGTAADYLQAAGKTRVLLTASAVSGCVNLVLALFLIPKFGTLGALYATGAAALVIAAIHALYSRELLRVRFPLKAGFLAIASSALSAFLTELFIPSSIEKNPLILLGVFACFFLFLCYITKPLTFDDVESFRSLGERLASVAQLFARPQNLITSVNGSTVMLTDRQKWAFAWMSKCRVAVDIGSSASPLCSLLARKAEQPFAVDTDRSALVMLKQSKAPIHIVQASALSLPLPSDSVDTVLLLDVLEHVGAERGVIGEVHRILRPGGTLILSVPHKGAFQFLDPQNLRARLNRAVTSIPLHRHYSAEGLSGLLFPRFRLGQKHYGGLFLYPLTFAANNFFGNHLQLHWGRFFKRLGDFDNDISWGRLSYNLIISAQKVA
jgi:O-antigen/teichoic acid export membrane protein/SAM-dependent methyltransferase